MKLSVRNNLVRISARSVGSTFHTSSTAAAVAPVGENITQQLLSDGSVRYKIGVQYCGTHYSGFSHNKEAANPSVISVIEEALQQFVRRDRGQSYSNIKVSSRTDAGVHALRNVFQVDISRSVTVPPNAATATDTHDIYTGRDTSAAIFRAAVASPKSSDSQLVTAETTTTATTTSRAGGFAFSSVGTATTATSKAYAVSFATTSTASASYSTPLSAESIATAVIAADLKESTVTKTTESTAAIATAISATTAQQQEYFCPNAVRRGLNFYLRPSKSLIFITDVSIVSNAFDARLDATARTYCYRIIAPRRPLPTSPKSNDNQQQQQQQQSEVNFRDRGSLWSLFHVQRAWVLQRPLDLSAMRRASELLLGRHDFSSFRNSGCQSLTAVRNVISIDIRSNAMDVDQTGDLLGSSISSLVEHDTEVVTITVTANAFLLRMVRNIVGMLVHVGYGDLTVAQAATVLQLRDRSKISISPAPAAGLYLVNVYY